MSANINNNILEKRENKYNSSDKNTSNETEDVNKIISNSKFKDAYRISLWDLSSNWNEIRKFNDSSIKSNWNEVEQKKMIQLADKSLDKGDNNDKDYHLFEESSSNITEVNYNIINILIFRLILLKQKTQNHQDIYQDYLQHN